MKMSLETDPGERNCLIPLLFGKKKVAVFDGAHYEEVGLYLKGEDGDLEDLPWPSGWPEVVTAEFLKQQGFEVVYA